MNVVFGGYRFSSQARTPLVGTQLLARLGYNSRADAEVFTERVRQELGHRHGRPAKVRQIAFH